MGKVGKGKYTWKIGEQRTSVNCVESAEWGAGWRVRKGGGRGGKKRPQKKYRGKKEKSKTI